MTIIILSQTRWKWVLKTRLLQRDLYYWAVKCKGDSFYEKGLEINLKQAWDFAKDPGNPEYQLI